MVVFQFFVRTDKSQAIGKLKNFLVAPFVLRELIPRKAYDCFCLLKDIYSLVYSKQLRIEWWHQEHHEYFRKVLWKHAILFEEIYGLASCTENLEYSLHTTEDVKRHSLLDNYWCFTSIIISR